MTNSNVSYHGSAAWRDLKTNIPPLRDFQKLDKPYVLAVDAKGRMTIAYAYKHSTGEIGWTMAKPVGAITHWMPLPKAPNADDFETLRIVSNNRLASLESNILKLKHELLRLRNVVCPDDITNIDSVLSETSNP